MYNSYCHTDESDYTAVSGNVFNFNNGQRRGCVDITITDDTTSENKEQFSLRLYANSGGLVILPESFVLNPNITTVTIHDNECKQIQ